MSRGEIADIWKGSQKLFLKSENIEKGMAVRVSESTVHNVVIYVGSVTSAQLPYSTKPQRQKAEAVLKYK